MKVRGILALLTAATLSGDAAAQGVRSHTRLTPRGTTVSKDQAVELTLTVAPATVRPIQVWVRAAGVLDASGRSLIAYLPVTEGVTIKPDQRARAFPVESRSSMYQARVSRVAPENGRVRVEVTMIAPPRAGTKRYVLEIVTDRGEWMSVPNEAIIEESGKRVVYIQKQEGQYEPQEITIGLQGELYTQVLSGLPEGAQVVTFGSFFIDSEFKLKGSAGQ